MCQADRMEISTRPGKFGKPSGTLQAGSTVLLHMAHARPLPTKTSCYATVLARAAMKELFCGRSRRIIGDENSEAGGQIPSGCKGFDTGNGITG